MQNRLSIALIWAISILTMLGVTACTVQPIQPGTSTPDTPTAAAQAANVPRFPTAPADHPTVEPAATPDVSDAPQAAAPHDLATIELPTTQDAIIGLLEQLPGEMAGVPRTPQFDIASFDRVIVGYGEDTRVNPDGTARLSIQVLDATTGDFFPPNWQAQHVIETLGQNRVIERGRDGDLHWLLTETTVTPADSSDSIALYSLTWGAADSDWVFSANADTRAQLEPLVTAFVEAAQTDP